MTQDDSTYRIGPLYGHSKRLVIHSFEVVVIQSVNFFAASIVARAHNTLFTGFCATIKAIIMFAASSVYTELDHAAVA